MSSLFHVKKVNPLGISTVDPSAGTADLQTQQRAADENRPVPTSAVEFTDDLLNAQPWKINAPPTAAPQRPGITSNPLAVMGMFGGAVRGAGTLTPEQREAEGALRLDAATAEEAEQQALTEEKARIRGMTPVERERAGLPAVSPFMTPERIAEFAASEQDELAEARQIREKAENGPLPTQTWWLNVAQVGLRSAAQMGVSAAKYPATIWEESIGRMYNGNEVVSTEYSDWIDGVEKELHALLPGDKARSQDFVTELSAGAGSFTAFMMAGWLGSAVGLPALATAGLVGATVEGQTAYEEAERFEATDLQKIIALFVGSALGTTEAVPIDRMLMRADAGTGGLVRRMLRNTTAGGIEEFVQEVSQAVGTDISAKYLAGFDPDRELDPESYLRSGLIGGITGAGGGLVLTGLSGDVARVEDAPPLDPDIDTSDEALELMRKDFVEQQIAEQQNVIRGIDGMGEVMTELEAAGNLPPLPEGTDRIEGMQIPLASPVETPEFKTWFGDSAVVDEQGAPLVVYHGTTTDFAAFDAASARTAKYFYFTPDTQAASGYGNVGAYYLKAARVADLRVDFADEPDTHAVLERVYEAIGEDFGFSGLESFVDAVTGGQMYQTHGRGLQDAVMDEIRSDGFDGVRITDAAFGGAFADSFVVFEPTQIKSALSNIGAFAPSDPDIEAVAGDTPPPRRGATGKGTATRPPLSAEQTRPAGGIDIAADAQRSEVSLANISRDLIGLMELTARQGRMTLKKALGQYSRRSGAVRLVTWNDLSVLVHEAGHVMNDNMAKPLDNFVTDHLTDVIRVGKDHYGVPLDTLPPNKQRREGYAEFFRLFVLNRAYVRRKYPKLTADYEALLTELTPDLLTGLDSIGAQFEAWLQLPSAQLVSGMIVDSRVPTATQTAILELREKGFKTWMQEHTRNVLVAGIDRYANLNKLVSDILNVAEEERGGSLDLKRADDARVLARLSRNSGNRAMVQVTDGVMGYRSVQPSTRSLRDALVISQGGDTSTTPAEIDEARLQDFDAYLVALRAADEYRRLREGLITRPPINATLGDVRTTIKDMEAKYGQAFMQAADIAHEYGMGLWQKQYDAGLISQQTYEDGLTRHFYVPLQRDMSDRKGEKFGKTAVTDAKHIVKRFRGSDRDIVSPMAVLMEKTFALESLISENDAKLVLATLADRAGRVGALVERVPSQQIIGAQYEVAEVARQLTRDDTLSDADAADLITLLDASMENGNTITMFRSQQAATRGENVMFFWEHGRLAAIQLKDGDVGADIVNVMNGAGRENMPMFMEIITATSTAFRASITSWPDFLAVNFIRDQFSAWILSDVGFVPFKTGIEGMAEEIRQSDWARMYNASQGIMGGMNVAALHESRVEHDIRAMRAKGYIAKAFEGTGFKGAAKGMARLVELSETGTRVGLYKAAFTKARADGLTEYEASVEAAYLATDYIDFGLGGTRMLLLRRTIPFLSAQLNGLYKMMRTLGGDEVAQRKGLKFALGAYFKNINGLELSRTEKQALRTGRKAWIKMAVVGMIGTALWAAYRDDPDYQEAGEYLRATGWVIPLGGGRLFYIPKPFELALLGNAMERGLEFASGDKAAPGRFLRGAALNLVPPASPPLIQVAVELAANKDFFSDREIVPSYMQALEPELQYNNYTSDLAKWLGKATGQSPMVVDHILSGLGASAYRDTSTMINAANPNRPAMDFTDMPLVRRFVRDARRGSASARDFWEQASALDGRLRRGELSYRSYLEGGNEPAANNYLSSLSTDEQAYALLMTHFGAKAKRLNPFYRGRQQTRVISAMRREIASNSSLERTGLGETGNYALTAGEKNELDEALSEISRREVRNTLIATGAPGWAGKAYLPTDEALNYLKEVSPAVRQEYDRRVRKAKVYKAETVFRYWPEVRDRLIRDHENAILSDIVAIAGAGL